MSFKTNILIGGLVVLIVFLISAVTFYFSLGSCPIGSFACDNGTTCVPQRSVCNKRKDCKDGFDEDEIECGNFAGGTNLLSLIMDKTFLAGIRLNQTNATDCVVNLYPSEYCKCVFSTTVLCRNKLLKSFPEPLSEEITHLFLSNINISELPQKEIYLPILEHLNLKNTNISKLNEPFFSGMINLKKLQLQQNFIHEIPSGVFRNLTNLEYLFLDSNLLRKFSLNELKDLHNLVWLNLSNNYLTLENERFPSLPKIYDILLHYNEIDVIDEFLFSKLYNLELLSLNNNRITCIHQNAFRFLTVLKELRLSDNFLFTLPGGIFKFTKLDALHLSFNNISITESVLQNINCTYLNLDGIEANKIDFTVLSKMKKLQIIVYKEFYYCSNTPNVRHCSPKTDGISSLEDLLSKPILRYSAWIMAILTCLGNSLVLWGRSTLRDENRTVSMVIRNLAVADMLMGFYLCIIGVQDFRFRKIYHEIAHEWVASWTCVASGILAMISSEVSMLIMAFMSIERFLLIADPFGGHQKFNSHNVFVTLFTIWLIGTTIAIIPVILWRSSTLFYGSNTGTCFPLHLQEKYQLGWEYSAFVFIGLNMTLLVLIAILYSALLISIWRTRKATPLSLLDSEFVIRFFFIVLVDASCWIPIIIYKVLTFMSIRISGDVYAWLVVFILPLNSAINPLLYTFTTPRYRDKFFCGNWYRLKWKNSRRDGSAGTSNQDDSQGKIIPLLYTHGTSNYRF